MIVAGRQPRAPWVTGWGQRLRWAVPRFIAAVVATVFAASIALNLLEDRFLEPPEGSLLIDGLTGVVYRFEAGRKRVIANTETMRCLRQPGQHFIRYRSLNLLLDGPPIENREGCRLLPPAGYLVQPNGSADVYLSTGASLRQVPNPRTLECLSILRPIEVVAPGYLTSVPVGPPVPDGENCR